MLHPALKAFSVHRLSPFSQSTIARQYRNQQAIPFYRPHKFVKLKLLCPVKSPYEAPLLTKPLYYGINLLSLFVSVFFTLCVFTVLGIFAVLAVLSIFTVFAIFSVMTTVAVVVAAGFHLYFI